MRLAYATAGRASCPRRQVGAIIVDDTSTIIASGYNGAPRGLPSCDEVGCDVRVLPGGKPEGSCVRTLHAESNAIDRAGLATRGCTLFCTTIPCRECALRIIQAGISTVIYHEFYESRGSSEVCDLFRSSKLPFRQMDVPLSHVKPTYSPSEVTP